MNWIFTIIFSGLLLSNNQTTKIGQADVPASPQSQSTVVRMDETDRFEQTYPLTANGRVSVSNVNGSISLEAWDRNEVKLVAIKTAESKERLEEVEVRIDAKPDSFSVETKYDNWKRGPGGWKNGGKLQVEYQLMVPRGAVLNDIDAVNGSVNLSNFTNVTKASAVNGTVKATNLKGTADLSTVNGEVAADFTTLEPGSKITLGTVNGKVNLTIPSDSNATIKVDSVNGEISNDFGLPVRKGKYVGRDLYGRLGTGDVRIKLESVNGDLKILRQNDGRNLSPATNLLNQKEKDDDDWDADANADLARADSAMAKANRDIARVDREAVRASARAVADAQREIAKARPEIERAVAESMKSAAVLVNSEQIQNALKDGLKQAASLARLSDIGFFPGMPRVERKSDTFAVKGVPKVKVETHGCAIKVTGWDRSEVKYSVTQMSPARDRTPVDVKESHDGSSVTLNVTADDDIERTRIEIFVPKRTNLVIKTDSEIRLDGVSGEIDLSGQDGAINVRDVDGKLTVASSDGRIRVIGFKGEISSKTSDGQTYLEGEFSKITAHADGGEITVTVADDAAASIKTRSAETKVEGLPAVLVRENDEDREFRLGKGGAAFDLSSDGIVVIRSGNALRETL